MHTAILQNCLDKVGFTNAEVSVHGLDPEVSPANLNLLLHPAIYVWTLILLDRNVRTVALYWLIAKTESDKCTCAAPA